jgi:hypothetical protein
MMIKTEEIAAKNKYAATILGIRRRNFEKNIPFLILSAELPDGQAYREFNDGRIELQEVYTEGARIKSRVLRILSHTEAAKIRLDNGLF